MGLVYSLAAEDGWSLDDALYEFASARPDIDTLLQPRMITQPAVPPKNIPSSERPRQSTWSKGAGRSDAWGDNNKHNYYPNNRQQQGFTRAGSQSGSRGQRSKNPRMSEQWPSNWALKTSPSGGQTPRGNCMHWNLSQCTAAQSR